MNSNNSNAPADMIMYRVVSKLTHPYYAGLSAVTMFLMAKSEESAKKAAIKIFKGMLVDTGIPASADFTITVLLSSEAEMEEFQKSMVSLMPATRKAIAELPPINSAPTIHSKHFNVN